MNKLIIQAPAKINLVLNVLNKRPDGYHELETIMHQISLIDTINIELCKENITVESNSNHIPFGEENLAYKAASLFMGENGIKAGVKIYIEKNIPVGAGLAGGSTDAAAVLLGLNRLFRLELSLNILYKMGAEVGSDVPFCLGSRTALAKGRGELLTPVDTGPKLDLVLVVPDFSISTAEVYKNYRFFDNQHADTTQFIKHWNNCDIISVASHLKNDLESVSMLKYNEINIIKNHLIKLGAINALMSGSGPAVFGIFTDRDCAFKAANTLLSKYEKVFQVTSYYRSDLNG